MTSLESREWWQFVPAEERELYQKAGFTKSMKIDGLPALLVIDVTHNFTGTKPLPLQEAIKEFPTSCGDVAWRALPHIRKLLDVFRSRGLPVIYTGRDVAAQEAHKGSTKRSGNVRDGNDFADLVRPQDGEWLCTKARASAFYGTSLDAYLRIKRVQSLVVVGGSTSGCVRASCVDAFSAGFQVIAVEDACFDRARTPHLANLFDLNAKYANVMTADEVIAGMDKQQAA